MIKPTFRVSVKRVIIFVALILLYVIMWNAIVNHPVDAFVLNDGNGGGNIVISDSVSVVVMRYNFIPIYWSEIGRLTTMHNIFGLLVTTACFITFEKKKNLLEHAVVINKLKGGE
ncbi:MAG: hypothetical protein KAY32_17015, partial [Candidatus Eisenbacteria sp.]|nr:hypothetical protein [Candidatus Eisenbacteria bacterium]